VIVNPPKPTPIIAQSTTEKTVQNGPNNSNHQTTTQKAFKIFKRGGELYDVIMELGVEPDEAKRLQKQFWEVQGLDHLSDLEAALGTDGLISLYNLNQKLTRNGIDADDYASALKEYDQVLAARSEKKRLDDTINSLKLEISRLDSVLADRAIKLDERNKMEAHLDQFKSEIRKRQDILQGIQDDPTLSRAFSHLVNMILMSRSTEILPKRIRRVAELMVSAVEQDKTVTVLLSPFKLDQLLFSNDLLERIAKQECSEEAARQANEALMTYVK
jgi:hypothetical protein